MLRWPSAVQITVAGGMPVFLRSRRVTSGLFMLSLPVAELAQSFGKRGETPKVMAASATVGISKLNVDAARVLR